jgi:hypothetical protein
MIVSDIRLKENIELAGVDEITGLNLYDFNYKWGEKRFRGVMAQEVKPVISSTPASSMFSFNLMSDTIILQTSPSYQ